jgi:hypothetical protein
MILRAHSALMVLTSMIVVGSIALLITVFVIMGGIDLLEQGLVDTEYNQTFLAADACAEEALQSLNSNHAYSGGDFVIGTPPDEVDCTITVVSALDIRTITVVATQDAKYVSDLELTVDVGVSPIEVTNWEQVAN